MMRFGVRKRNALSEREPTAFVRFGALSAHGGGIKNVLRLAKPHHVPLTRYRHRAGPAWPPNFFFALKERWAIARVHKRQSAQSAERNLARQWPIRP